MPHVSVGCDLRFADRLIEIDLVPQVRNKLPIPDCREGRLIASQPRIEQAAYLVDQAGRNVMIDPPVETLIQDVAGLTEPDVQEPIRWRILGLQHTHRYTSRPEHFQAPGSTGADWQPIVPR